MVLHSLSEQEISLRKKHSFTTNALRHKGAMFSLGFRTLLIVAALCVFSTCFLMASKNTYAAALHPNSIAICHSNHIASAANGLYVSAELGGAGDAYARLRARTMLNNVGPWELFTICTDLSTRNTTIQSQANGLYVSAEVNFTGSNYGLLRARASTIGPWEQFRLVPLSNGITAIQSLANGLYVSAELGGTGDDYARLRARTAITNNVFGPWEQFNISANL